MSFLLTQGVLQQQANRAGGPKYALEFDGVDDFVAFSNVFPEIDDIKIEIGIIGQGQQEAAQVFFGYRNEITELIQITRSVNSDNILFQIRGDDTSLIQITDTITDNQQINYEGYVYRSQPLQELLKNNEIVGSDNNDLSASIIGSSRMFLGCSSLYPRGNENFFSKIIIYKFKATNPTTGEILVNSDFSVGSGSTLPDLSGNNRNGTIYGANWIEL